MTQANTTVSDERLIAELRRDADILVAHAKKLPIWPGDNDYEDAAARIRLAADLLSSRRATADVTEALQGAELALCDWLHTYAPDMCDPARVKEAESRVHERGTIAYIANALAPIRGALKQQAPE